MTSFARHRTGRTALVGTAVLALSLATAAPAMAAPSAKSHGRAAVSQGTDVPALHGAKAFGKTPANTPETVSFVLRERNLPQLESSVTAGRAGDLSVTQFAGIYGQSPQLISQLEQYLAGYGIHATAYADDVDVVANGTAGQFDKALAVTEQQYRVPAQHGHDGHTVRAQTVHAAAGHPTLPADIAANVLAILGLTNYAPFTTEQSQVDRTAVKAKAGASNSCVALTGLASACHVAQDFASQYGLDSLYKAGDEGAGQTIGIVTLAALDQGAPEYYWTNVAHIPSFNRTVTVDNIDGGPGAPSDNAGSSETDLDVEQSGGVAPAANVIVYQAPNTDPGFADAFFTAASQDVAGSVSSSWGESETVIAAAVASGEETPAYEAAFDEAFLELAAQGQSAFASSADEGAYTASADLGTTNLSVDSPADSPYITAAGGTTDPWSGTLTNAKGTVTASVSVPNQRAWGWDYLWKALATVNGTSLATAAEADVAGSGGGYSTIEPRPSYQQDVSGVSTFRAVPYLTPTDYKNVDGIVEPTAWSFDPSPSVVSGSAPTGRALPDVSANADPYSGYLLYSPAFTQAGDPALEGGWGGTSFVAPQLNGATAVIDSAVGHRVGFWNPTSYAAAASGHGSPFTPLDQSGPGNDNIYFTGTPGTVYNAATGLGTPNLSALASVFEGHRS